MNPEPKPNIMKYKGLIVPAPITDNLEFLNELQESNPWPVRRD